MPSARISPQRPIQPRQELGVALADRDAFAVAKPLRVAECRPDEVELGAEIGFQETLGEGDVIAEREVEPPQSQIDEDLVGVAIASDRAVLANWSDR